MTVLDEIQDLERQIDRANQRCDDAWDHWDLDAYEGAVATGKRLYARLQELRGNLSHV